MTESDIVKACLDWLALKQIESWRQNQGAIPLKDGGYRSFNGRKGVADISGILAQTAMVDGEKVTFGNRLEIEVKLPGKKPSADQQEFLDMINAQGGIGICVSSVDQLEEELSPFLELDQS